MGVVLERADDLSVLEEALAGVRTGGEGQLVLVAGEAGVGKTALIVSFCESLPASCRVLWGACEPLLAPRPLGPLLDVAEVLGPDLRELVLAGARPHEVAAALMRELQAGVPAVLVLEDMHWADEATLDVLTLLGRRVRLIPTLVVASFRDDELDRAVQLRVVLGELGGHARRLRLTPLSQAAVSRLAEPFEVDAHELYRTTGGNPFFVTEVLGAVGERIPETVRDAVLARLARLSSGARALLEAVAIVPGHADLWLLGELAGDAVDRLDECLASGVVNSDIGQVAFRNELARLAVEAAIEPNRRLALHRRALAALAGGSGETGGSRARGDADFAHVAHHAEAAGDAEQVLRWAPRAGTRAASSGAHREAAEQYARALRFAEALPADERAELLRSRAEECRMSAQFDAAIAAQEEELACRRLLGDLRGEGDSVRSLSRLLFFAGRTREGEAAALEAVELLERLPAGHELAMAYCNVSQRRMVVEDYAEALAWGTRSLELAQRLGDTEALVYALTNIGAAQLEVEETEGRANMERALELARASGLEDYAGRAFVLFVLWAARRRRYETADEYLGDGLDYCGERGLDTWRLYLVAYRARIELDRGRWVQAGDSAALVLGDPRIPPVARGWTLPTLALLRARRGDAGVSGPLAEAHAIVQATAEVMRIGPVAAARAEAAWLMGENAAVKDLTDDALALALHRRAAWTAGELAYWRWEAGVHDDLPAGRIAEPYRLSIAGEWARAAALWREIGCPYEAALALAHADAEPPLRRAHEELRALGAGPAAAIVARRLRERGARGVPRGPRPRTRENPAGLTARELDVVALLADGLRNSEIAERLVVSEKTVGHHVSAILRKLDASTRGEAAAKALRLGLADPT